MKPMTLAGLVLAVLGVLILSYSGFAYTRRETVLAIGPIHATVDTHDRNYLPPVLGGLILLAGGIALLVINPRQRA
jgi:uncharacterized membrane protein